VLAFDRKTGQLLWDRSIGQGKLPANKLHNMATPTPVSDGQHIWAMFGTGDLACLEPDGSFVWQRNLVKEYGEYKTNHGYGSSPMLYDGKLFIACMHQGPSYLVAVDAATGKNAWKTERNLGPKDEAQDSYSSPILVQTGGKTEVVLAGAESVNAYNPADGQQTWIAGGMIIAFQILVFFFVIPRIHKVDHALKKLDQQIVSIIKPGGETPKALMLLHSGHPDHIGLLAETHTHIYNGVNLYKFRWDETGLDSSFRAQLAIFPEPLRKITDTTNLWILTTDSQLCARKYKGFNIEINHLKDSVCLLHLKRILSN